MRLVNRRCGKTQAESRTGRSNAAFTDSIASVGRDAAGEDIDANDVIEHRGILGIRFERR